MKKCKTQHFFKRINVKNQPSKGSKSLKGWLKLVESIFKNYLNLRL